MTWTIRHQRPIVSARAKPARLPERRQGYLANAQASIAEPFKGVTVDGEPVRGLFALTATGVPTEPIRRAAEAFMASLTAEQKARVTFELEGSEWRHWSHIHPWIMRHGIALDEMSSSQRDAVLALLASCLSERGFTTARDVTLRRADRGPAGWAPGSAGRLRQPHPARPRRRADGRGAPSSRRHGNDYGRDLLRQHHERFVHPPN